MTQSQGPKLRSDPPEDIALSLSGGGHRATLYCLGVVLALVDRGLNSRVKHIASVSGGSIVNAFIALHCKYNDPQLTTDEFDKIAAKLVKIIVYKGILNRITIVVLLSVLLIPPPIFIWLAWNNTISWYYAIPLVVIWLCLALLRGLIIEWIIEIRYFPLRIKFKLLPPRLKITRIRLRDLHDSSVEHVFCCTDLVEPGPVCFSSEPIKKKSRPGSFFSGIDNNIQWIKRSATNVTIAAVVRASAAFPGIPPRLVL